MKKCIIILFSGLFLASCEPKPVETEQVETPTASPVAGLVNIDTEITLQCATEGATIHYTLNGDTPSSESEIYNTPIPVNEGITIKAIAVKSGMDNSEILVAEYSVEAIDDITKTIGDISFTLKIVKGGTFTMGCTGEQEGECKSNELPLRDVTLSDFYLGEKEVTQALWLAVMDSFPDKAPGENDGAGDNYPAVYISWNDIVGTSGGIGYSVNVIDYYKNGFLYKLSQLTGDGKQFRLPTEAEWEYAARGGNVAENQTKYSGSDNVGTVAWYYDNAEKMHEVGTKAANALGIFDMSGNAWEWCSDLYGAYSSEDETNPTGAELGNNRVFRGGSYFYPAERHRVSYRLSFAAGARISDVGFRIAFSL
jgi:formylglycine-generating enzyme required for sulfatase activity